SRNRLVAPPARPSVVELGRSPSKPSGGVRRPACLRRRRPMLAHLLDRARRLAHTGAHALRQRFLSWTRPAAATSLVLGTIADLARSRSELVAENALLRQQVIVLARTAKRPRLTRADRPLLVLLASGVRAWRQALLIVQPETLLRRHRAGFRLL